MKKYKGFTLIELLVVVAIIGILATIVISLLSNARDKSNDASVKNIFAQMRTQVALDYTDNFNTVCDPETITGDMWREAASKPSNSEVGGVWCYDNNGSFRQDNGNMTGPHSHPNGADSNGHVWAMQARLSNGTWICLDQAGTITIDETRQTNNISPLDKTC
jgi:prepilin-type N-terminal cleavage/methylation domain-containing protein